MRAEPTSTGQAGRGAALVAGLAMLAALPAAAQQTCGAMVEQFAADHSLSTQPPPTAVPAPPGSAGSSARSDATDGSGAASSERLAQSGGLIAPPAVGDRAVIDPPRSGASNMPTAPAVRPDAGSNPAQGAMPGGSGGAGDTMGRAARNAQLESLVTAARAAARDGDETRCMDSLGEARRLSLSTPGGSGG
ncbi:hypothetical protein J2847_001555 [Azospirillum agricola]|uniref:hypothetical protein n=1 Tax=Azospirillum agricola TaxID=1720247 RepID=UPI001AE38693|nr:hypothetical protein [Azospirillum agricola]MBP2228273.1 hypothetical protein [Azospirillum agricola]